MTINRKYWSNSGVFLTILKVIGILVFLLLILTIVKSCERCSIRANIVDKTGYLPENEDWDNIPDIIPPYNDDDTLDIPERVMLEHYFPPIGNQEDKGTCVAWAVGYNLKTALNAIDNGWDTSILSNPAYQTSPKDLWLCISSQYKGVACSGTGFEPAFSALSSVGATSMEVSPYQDFDGCDGVGIGDSSNRISSYYHVINNNELPKVGQLKAYLADSIPLVIGARLGDNFLKWDNDRVINYDTYRYSGMHANHAMVLVGYDDKRQAFRVRNSWGTEWGDNGSIWVDYRFFCQEFCFVVFMVENK